MTIIRDAPKADNPVRLFRILSGRHRGRPSLKYEPTSSTQTYHQCLPRSLKMNHHLKFRCALMGVFTLRPCASAGKQQVVLDFLRLAGVSFCAAIVRQAQRANRMISHRDAGLFAVGQYWFIDICGGNLLGRVDLRVDRGHLINHMTIQDAPIADGYLRRSRIGSGRHRGRPSPRARSHSSLPDLFILICQITLMAL